MLRYCGLGLSDGFVEDFKSEELKEFLRLRGLQVNGRKEVLVAY